MINQYGTTVLIITSLIQVRRSIQTEPEDFPRYVLPTRQNDVTMCPYVSAWKDRAEEFCKEDDVFLSYSRYHCLEKQTGGYVELCMDPETVKEGVYPKVTFSESVRIYFERCPHGFYQPREGLSNDINKCRMKSKCSQAIGQLSSWCPDGGTTKDQQCRCDFQRGYIANLYALGNPLKESCFTPSTQNSACSMDNTCRGDKELDKAYRCVRKCPKNWHRPPEELECKPSVIYETSTISNINIDSTQASSQSTNSEEWTTTVSPPQMNNFSDVAVIVVAVVVSVILGVLIAAIIIFFCIFRRHIGRTEEQRGRDEGGIEERNGGETPNNGQPQPCAINISAEKVTYKVINIAKVENLVQGDHSAITVSSED